MIRVAAIGMVVLAGCCESPPPGPGTMCADGHGTCDDAIWLGLVREPLDDGCDGLTVPGAATGAASCVRGNLTATPFYGNGCEFHAFAYGELGTEAVAWTTDYGWDVDAESELITLRVGPLALGDFWSRDTCIGTELEEIARVDEIDAVEIRVNSVPPGFRLSDGEQSLLYSGTIEIEVGDVSWWRPFEYFMALPDGPDALHERSSHELAWTRIEGLRPEERHAYYMPDPDAPEHHDRALGERSWRRTPVEVLP